MSKIPFSSKESSPQYMYKDVWGPKAWKWLHVQAINYSNNPTRKDKMIMFKLFWSFILTLPCPECRVHAMKYISAHPPDFSSSISFQTWAWRFHNAVNHRIGKPIMSPKQYRQTYSSYIRNKL